MQGIPHLALHPSCVVSEVASLRVWSLRASVPRSARTLSHALPCLAPPISYRGELPAGRDVSRTLPSWRSCGTAPSETRTLPASGTQTRHVDTLGRPGRIQRLRGSPARADRRKTVDSQNQSCSLQTRLVAAFLPACVVLAHASYNRKCTDGSLVVIFGRNLDKSIYSIGVADT